MLQKMDMWNANLSFDIPKKTIPKLMPNLLAGPSGGSKSTTGGRKSDGVKRADQQCTSSMEDDQKFIRFWNIIFSSSNITEQHFSTSEGSLSHTQHRTLFSSLLSSLKKYDDEWDWEFVIVIVMIVRYCKREDIYF